MQKERNGHNTQKIEIEREREREREREIYGFGVL
jgi:hypothetical protein